MKNFYFENQLILIDETKTKLTVGAKVKCYENNIYVGNGVIIGAKIVEGKKITTKDGDVCNGCHMEYLVELD